MKACRSKAGFWQASLVWHKWLGQHSLWAGIPLRHLLTCFREGTASQPEGERPSHVSQLPLTTVTSFPAHSEYGQRVGPPRTYDVHQYLLCASSQRPRPSLLTLEHLWVPPQVLRAATPSLPEVVGGCKEAKCWHLVIYRKAANLLSPCINKCCINK